MKYGQQERWAYAWLGQVYHQDGYTGRYRGHSTVRRHSESIIPVDVLRVSMTGEVNGRYMVQVIQDGVHMYYRFSSKSRARRLIRAYQSLGIPARLYRWRRV